MSSGMIFVLMIITITMIGGIMKARYGYRRDHDLPAARDDGETLRLKEEVRALKERLQVLERITTDPAERTAREIEALRLQPN